MSRMFRSCIHLFALCGIIVSSIAFPHSLLRAENNSPLDTPLPVVANNKLEQWSLGAGLIYWSNDCVGEEFGTHADLKRKPVGGGTERDIQTIDDGQCQTFLNQLSASDGLYYFNDSANQLQRMPLSPPFTPQKVVDVVAFQIPDDRSQPLVEANGYLYWGVFGAVLRTRMDGSSAVETVANASGSVSSVVVVGNLVYFVDNSRFTTNGGVKTILTNCATLPCSNTMGTLVPFATGTEGHGLVYQPNAGSGLFRGYNIYWVQSATSSSKIRSCFISDLATPCQDPVIQPLGASSTDEIHRISTFYETTISIGNPIFVPASAAKSTKDLYWTETGSGVSDVKRRATNASTPTTSADTIATNQTNLDRRLFVADTFIYFARSAIGVYQLALNATPIVREFVADGLEVTQAIQNLANAAPLVAKKPTYVRAYGKQLFGPDTPNVEARLTGTKNGNPLPGSPLQSINGMRSLVTNGSYNRARTNDGWLFQLPESWIAAGAISLKLEIDGRQIHTDPNRTNNELTQTVSFQTQPPVCVWTVPVRTHTPLPSINDPNFWSMVDQFTRRWPIPQTWIFKDTEPVEELEICTWHHIPYPCFGPYELEDGWSITNGDPDAYKVLTSLWVRQQLTFDPDICEDASAPVHFMGMVHPDANNGGAAGMASPISNQSWVQLPEHVPNPVQPAWNKLFEGAVMAQELGHNYFRSHVDCGNPSWTDDDYPYPPCQIANVGADSYYGFDPASRQAIEPNRASDFMSYGWPSKGIPSWVSDYTWRGLLGEFSAAGAASLAPAQADAGESVFVAGSVISDTNSGKISTVLVLPTNSLPPATRRGNTLQAASADHSGPPEIPNVVYKLRLLDTVGTILLERTLTVIAFDHHSANPDGAFFSDLFAKPAGTVAKIQLLADGVVLDTIQPGSAVPTVAVTSPTTGAVIENAMTIQWSASDADPDDRLLFTVQYSHDNGAKWHTLVSNFPSTPEGQYTLTFNDLGSLQSSAPNAALIRVLASDGYNTGIGISPAFTVKNRPPLSFIATPGNGENFEAGETVVLRGGATDPEEGGLSGNSIAWSVDGISVGNGTEVPVAGLGTGSHTVVMTATDSLNNSSVATIDFTISTLPIPLVAAPTLDGHCDDSSYGAGKQLQLQPYSDGSQATVRIVRSADSLWACFSGLAKGAALPGSFAGLRIDVNNSRNPKAQDDDYGFFAGEDGSVSTTAGDGAGNFDSAGPAGLQAQVSAGSATWNAEFRIDKATIGGWNHLISITFEHDSLNSPGDNYRWSYHAIGNTPQSWSIAALGEQPTLTAIEPYTATAGSPTFTLTLEGSRFVSGTVALWGSVPLSTTVVDSEHLSATVTSAQLVAAGLVEVSTKSPAPDNFTSNTIGFNVEALAPVVNTLSPASLTAESGSTTLTVSGSRFSADSQVLWNGTPLATTFVSATQIKATIDASLLQVGQTVGVSVRNQSPEEKISNTKALEVTAAAPGTTIYLPLVSR